MASDLYFPRIETLGYLEELGIILRMLNERKARAYVFFRRCTLPSPGIMELIAQGRHEIGLHLEDSRSLTRSRREEDLGTHIGRPVRAVSKHGSGGAKYGLHHHAPYEPDKYVEWARRDGMKVFLGNLEDPSIRPHGRLGLARLPFGLLARAGVERHEDVQRRLALVAGKVVRCCPAYSPREHIGRLGATGEFVRLAGFARHTDPGMSLGASAGKSVLMIAYTNYRTDPRVIREVEAAVSGGFDVDFIALRREDDPPQESDPWSPGDSPESSTVSRGERVVVRALIPRVLHTMLLQNHWVAASKALPGRPCQQHARLPRLLRVAPEADGGQSLAGYPRPHGEHLRLEVQGWGERPAVHASSLAGANQRILRRPSSDRSRPGQRPHPRQATWLRRGAQLRSSQTLPMTSCLRREVLRMSMDCVSFSTAPYWSDTACAQQCRRWRACAIGIGSR